MSSLCHNYLMCLESRVHTGSAWQLYVENSVQEIRAGCGIPCSATCSSRDSRVSCTIRMRNDDGTGTQVVGVVRIGTDLTRDRKNSRFLEACFSPVATIYPITVGAKLEASSKVSIRAQALREFAPGACR
jgi:hypothetical protein